jgi:hypothetical protein
MYPDLNAPAQGLLPNNISKREEDGSNVILAVPLDDEYSSSQGYE